jgi:hypothetical protein
MLYAQLSNNFTYQWNYNGSPINGATADSFYTDSAGSYSCTISNGTCSLTTQPISVNIGTPPSANISTAYTSFCTGDSAAITANAGTGYTYTLYLNGTAIKISSNNVFFATQAGDYQVEVNNYGCTAMSNTITLTTIPGISVSISASGSTSFCNGDSVLLQATSDTTWFYQWTVNGNNVTNGNNDFVYATQNGTYQVLVVNANSCQALSNTIDVQVSPSPRANLNVPDSMLCAGDSVIISIQTGGGGGFGNSYQWMQNGTDLSGQTTRFLTVKTSGDYACKVTNQAGCTTTSRTTTIQVDTSTNTTFNVGVPSVYAVATPYNSSRPIATRCFTNGMKTRFLWDQAEIPTGLKMRLVIACAFHRLIAPPPTS